MGSGEIRSFLGGRHTDDKGLYVSTGGFTKDAYYEAERANIPVTLMNIDDLVEALTEHYENLDVETKQVLWDGGRAC
jgi:restriction system protein